MLNVKSQTCVEVEHKRLLGPDALGLGAVEIISHTGVQIQAKEIGEAELHSDSYLGGELGSIHFLSHRQRNGTGSLIDIESVCNTIFNLASAIDIEINVAGVHDTEEQI